MDWKTMWSFLNLVIGFALGIIGTRITERYKGVVIANICVDILNANREYMESIWTEFKCNNDASRNYYLYWLADPQWKTNVFFNNISLVAEVCGKEEFQGIKEVACMFDELNSVHAQMKALVKALGKDASNVENVTSSGINKSVDEWKGKAEKIRGTRKPELKTYS